MSNVSKCFSCTHKNDYDTKFGYYGCNLSGQECKGYSMFEPKSKPKTNRDRLRAMTDEELAKFFYDTDTEIPWCDECRSHHGEPNGCEKCMVDWLKEEAE